MLYGVFSECGRVDSVYVLGVRPQVVGEEFVHCELVCVVIRLPHAQEDRLPVTGLDANKIKSIYLPKKTVQ